MDHQIYYLETGSQDPRFNLAFEEYILLHRTQGDYLLLWQNANTIVVGQNQNAEAEIDRAFVEAHQIHVVRRTTGGGAVYHDLGNLNYSFITDAEDTQRLAMEKFTRPVVAALRELGLQAEASGRNDILIEGKKVSGTAQRLSGKRILHHGTLLFDSNSDMIAGALHADPTKFQSKGAQSVRSRVGNIRDFLQKDMDLPAFWEYLKQTLAGSGFTAGTLSAAELVEVETLKRSKYDTWEWNFGRSPAYTMTNKRRWDGGTLEVCLSVEKGCIREIGFYGDFLSLRSLETLTNALRGCQYRQDGVSAVMERFAIYEYFGGITLREVLETMFLN